MQGGGNNWLAGIEVQFDLFEGGAKRARLSHERAVQEKVAAVKEMAADARRPEVRRTYCDLDSADQQVEVAQVGNRDLYESAFTACFSERP